jgi:hypothetical protein
MQVYIRFLTVSAKLPKEYIALAVSDNATAEELLRAVESAGQAGAFCAAIDWPGLPEHVLLAADSHMLREQEVLYANQKISIIGQMIGG